MLIKQYQINILKNYYSSFKGKYKVNIIPSILNDYKVNCLIKSINFYRGIIPISVFGNNITLGKEYKKYIVLEDYIKALKKVYNFSNWKKYIFIDNFFEENVFINHDKSIVYSVDIIASSIKDIFETLIIKLSAPAQYYLSNSIKKIKFFIFNYNTNNHYTYLFYLSNEKVICEYQKNNDAEKFITLPMHYKKNHMISLYETAYFKPDKTFECKNCIYRENCF